MANLKVLGSFVFCFASIIGDYQSMFTVSEVQRLGPSNSCSRHSSLSPHKSRDLRR